MPIKLDDPIKRTKAQAKLAGVERGRARAAQQSEVGLVKRERARVATAEKKAIADKSRATRILLAAARAAMLGK